MWATDPTKSRPAAHAQISDTTHHGVRQTHLSTPWITRGRAQPAGYADAFGLPKPGPEKCGLPKSGLEKSGLR